MNIVQVRPHTMEVQIDFSASSIILLFRSLEYLSECFSQSLGSERKLCGNWVLG